MTGFPPGSAWKRAMPRGSRHAGCGAAERVPDGGNSSIGTVPSRAHARVMPARPASPACRLLSMCCMPVARDAATVRVRLMPDHAKSLMEGEFTRKVVVAAGLSALIVALLALVFFVARPLLVVFAGVLLAVLLRALTDFVHRYTKIPCGLALWIVVAALLGGVAGFAWFIVSQAAGQFEQLGRGLVEAWKRLEDFVSQYGWGRVALDRLSNGSIPKGSADIVARVTGGIVSAMSILVVSVFLGLYLAVNPSLYRRGLVRLFPVAHRERAASIMDKIAVALRGWLLGTLFNMVVIGAATTLGLWLLDIPMALALGIVAFFLEFIPYLGPILSAIPALLIASSVGPEAVLYTALLYWGVQSAEGYLLSPLVYQHSVDLPPALTLGAQIVFATLFGVLGIVFATPLTACALVFVQEAYVEDALGDPVEGEPEKKS